jgi:endoglycosylceramidase
VASIFRGEPGVLGYELMNEPWPGSAVGQCANPIGCSTFDTQLRRFVERTTRAIRQVDGRSLVWFEPNVLFNSGADQQLGRLDDPRLGFAFHDYCLARAPAAYFSDDPLAGGSCDAQEQLTVDHALSRVRTTDEALLLTEFGAVDDLGEVRRMVERAERARLSWQWWAYCGCEDPTTAGPGAIQAIVIDPKKAPQGANVKRDKLAILSRPYPQVVAGTPRSWRFNADSKELTVAFSTQRPGGGDFPRCARSEIYVGRDNYPDGYSAQLEGADVVSSRGARTLRIATRPGADEVRLTVRPGAERGVASRRVCRPLKRRRH